MGENRTVAKIGGAIEKKPVWNWKKEPEKRLL